MQQRTIRTEDGQAVTTGSVAFNYYDHKQGAIEGIDTYPQPNTANGQSSSTPVEEWNNYWFTFRHDDGTSACLDGSRICSLAFATKRGWLK